jgi:hypothetical protein
MNTGIFARARPNKNNCGSDYMYMYYSDMSEVEVNFSTFFSSFSDFSIHGQKQRI